MSFTYTLVAMRTRKSLITLLLLLAVPALLLWQRLAIFDWVRLRGYNPPVEVVKLADNTTMNLRMRQLFYVYHPSLEDKPTFNAHCRDSEQTIVLGCYINGRGIYLLDVTDDRLAGIEEVTAAHESLHAAYTRLSGKDRANVDRMVQGAFDSLGDQRVKDTIELYRKKDPNVVLNELHSILGTEVRTLPTALEEYYRRYFEDRLKVVGYSEQYEQAFTARKNQIKDYDAQLEALKQQIDVLQKSLVAAERDLARLRSSMNSLRSGNTAAYNAAVPGYNQKVASYNAMIDQLSSLVNQYNEIVPKRNAIASEEEELVKAIDSREIVPETAR